MENYKVLDKERRFKQFFMAGFFVIILLGGWYYPVIGYFMPLCMFLAMGIGLFRGRKWCDWFCPRGSFFEVLIKHISPKNKIPRFLKGLPLRIGFLSFLMLLMITQIIKLWPDLKKIGMFFAVQLSITTLLGVVLALIFHQRSWCCFCPIGSMANWAGRQKYPLRIDSGLCTDCGLCYKVCPIQIAPYKFKKEGFETVKNGDCLKCRLCVSACPKKALSLGDDELKQRR